MRRRDLPTEYRAEAPLRLDLAGGWTDVPPFSQREGGVVVNAAIGLYARVALRLGGELIRLVAEDLNQTVEMVDSGGLVADGRLPLHKAGLRMFPVSFPCTLATRCDAPAGSGLGSSGALDVALVAALSAARLERPDRREIAQHAWQLEAVEAALPGGKQDQFAAALGGVQRLTFRDPDVGVEPLTLDPMAEALRAADLAKVGALLAENWRHQRALDPGMCTPEMARLETALAAAGTLGGKAAGAGAGGCMFFLMADDSSAGAAAARAAGAELLPLRWAADGVRAW